jgi:periplasmic protein TonB
MIAGSRSLGVLALVLAVAVHAALGWALMAEVEADVAGGGGAQEVRIGTSFTDMAAGTLEAVEAGEIAQPVEAETVETLQPETLEPVRPETSKSVTAEPVEADLAPADVAKDALPTITALTPEPAPLSGRAEAVTADNVEDIVEAEAEQALSRSLRPRRRSAAFEKKNSQVVETAPTKPKKTRQPEATKRGNAEQSSIAGAVTGTAGSRAATSGTAGSKAASSGNAAASSYPGKVMRHLSRAPRPSVGARGTAVVAFSVLDGGGLAGVSIARSSGSAALDRAAVDMVRGAAPFPPPPAGAQRSFSISIEGR